MLKQVLCLLAIFQQQAAEWLSTTINERSWRCWRISRPTCPGQIIMLYDWLQWDVNSGKELLVGELHEAATNICLLIYWPLVCVCSWFVHLAASFSFTLIHAHFASSRCIIVSECEGRIWSKSSFEVSASFNMAFIKTTIRILKCNLNCYPLLNSNKIGLKCLLTTWVNEIFSVSDDLRFLLVSLRSLMV